MWKIKANIETKEEVMSGRTGPKRSTKKGRGADAPALGADERRGKLRKATGSRTQAKIRGCLNGETRTRKTCAPWGGKRETAWAPWGEPGELKHLSSRRNRKKDRYRQ